MKILHLISSSGFYGAENVVLNLLAMLKEDKHDASLICLKNFAKDDPEIHFRAKEEGNHLCSAHIRPPTSGSRVRRRYRQDLQDLGQGQGHKVHREVQRA